MATFTTQARICVFCSSIYGKHPDATDAARRLAELMHENNIVLIYGGGTHGLMGTLASERARLGGIESVVGITAFGVIDTEREAGEKAYLKQASAHHNVKTTQSKESEVRSQADNKVAELRALLTASGNNEAVEQSRAGEHAKLLVLMGKLKKLLGLQDSSRNNDTGVPRSKLAPGWNDIVDLPDDPAYGQTCVAPTLAVRKTLMMDFVKKGGPGSGFISLPGGFGSLDEVLEVLSHRQRKAHSAQMVLCNINGSWNGFRTWMDDAEEQGFLGTVSRSFVDVVDSPEKAIDIFMEQRNKAAWRLPGNRPA